MHSSNVVSALCFEDKDFLIQLKPSDTRQPVSQNSALTQSYIKSLTIKPRILKSYIKVINVGPLELVLLVKKIIT